MRKMNEISFSRESFDRFGDDLCEVVLSYLSITDCFRFQCVSKQWKALIFNGQKRLNINDPIVIKCISIKSFSLKMGANANSLDIRDLKNQRNINVALFAYVLKKCPFINELIISKHFDINDDIINAIASNCSHLKSLTIDSILDDISEHTIKLFGDNCGPKLERLYMESVNSKILRQLFPLMPNLRKITIGIILPDVYLFIAGANQTHFLPKLEEIGSELFIYNSFITFADQYRKQIKKLYVCLVVKEDELENSFDGFRQLSKFECLQSIKINCNFIECELTTFIRLLKSMVNDCKNLKELELENMCDSRLFDCFADGYESLRKLSLKSYYVNCANFECLKGCVNVTHISLFQKLLHANQFVDCDTFVPQLTSLRVSTEAAFTDDMLRCLAKLKHLRNLKLECRRSANKCKVSSKGICDLIDKCATLRKIHLSVKDIELISMKQLEKRGIIYIQCGEMRIIVKTLTNQLSHGVFYSSSLTRQIKAGIRDELRSFKFMKLRDGFLDKHVLKNLHDAERIEKIKILTSSGIVCHPFMLKEFFEAEDVYEQYIPALDIPSTSQASISEECLDTNLDEPENAK